MRNVIDDAYSALRKVTPLPDGLDCGKLCGARCCHGSNNDGMELFAGEEERFLGDPNFEIRESGNRKVLICKGKCDRKTRPLACRIYPFYPIPFKEKESEPYKIRVVYDIRGFASCPVIHDRIKPDPRFVNAVRLAGLYLMRDPENLKIMLETAELFNELVSFTQTMQ